MTRDDLETPSMPLLGARGAGHALGDVLLPQAFLGGDPVFVPSHYISPRFHLRPWSHRVDRHTYAALGRRHERQRLRQQRAALRQPGLRKALSAAQWPGGSLSARSPLGLPILPPTHPFMVGWTLFVLVVDLTYTALLAPLGFAFHQSPLHAPWVSISAGLLFTLDFLIMLHRGFVVKYLDGTLYVDGWRDAVWAYWRWGSLWLDALVAAAPAAQLALLAAVGGGQRGAAVAGAMQALVMVRGLRLVRLLALQRQLFFGKPAFWHFGAETAWFILSLCYVTAVLLTWLAAIMLLIAHLEDPPSSWLASVKDNDLTQAHPLRQLVAAYYFVTITAMTVGYGDVSAGTAAEQGAVIAIVFSGVTFIAYVVKGCVDAFIEAELQDETTQRVALLREQGRLLRVWSNWQEVPSDTMDRILGFYQGPFLNHSMVAHNWGALMQELPLELRGEVMEQVLMKHHPETASLGRALLVGVEWHDWCHVLAHFAPAPLCLGQALCWEGDPVEQLWLLMEGEVMVMRGVLPTATTISAPALLAPFDLAAWMDERQLLPSGGKQGPATAAAGDGAAALPDGEAAALASGGAATAGLPPLCLGPPPTCTTTLQSTKNCFLWAMPLKRAQIICRCLPPVAVNLDNWAHKDARA